MKPYLLIAAIVLFAANKGNSQCVRAASTYSALAPEDLAAALTQTMSGELGLNQKQAVIVEAINLEGYQKLDEICAFPVTDARSVEKAVKSVERTRDYKLRATLKLEQWIVYQRHTYGKDFISSANRMSKKQFGTEAMR